MKENNEIFSSELFLVSKSQNFKYKMYVFTGKSFVPQTRSKKISSFLLSVHQRQNAERSDPRINPSLHDVVPA